MSRAWDDVARDFHVRVRTNCWDSLATRLVELHGPYLDEGQPVCRGCDRDERGSSDPVWPCRTYTMIAAVLLDVASVEGTLAELLNAPKRS